MKTKIIWNYISLWLLGLSLFAYSLGVAEYLHYELTTLGEIIFGLIWSWYIITSAEIKIEKLKKP